jgi:hypothetical protein
MPLSAQRWKEITRTGVRAAKTVLYARALLLLDKNADSVKRWTVASVGEALGMTARTLEHLKERFVKYGLNAALERKKPVKPSRKLIFAGDFAARLTQLACSEAPAGVPAGPFVYWPKSWLNYRLFLWFQR